MDSVRTRAHLPEIPVDLDDLLARCLGRMDIVERVLHTFQRSLQIDLEQLEQAVQSLDADEIAHIAHRMKGASLSVAAHDLQKYAQSIESSAMTRQLENIPDYFVKLKQECARFDHI